MTALRARLAPSPTGGLHAGNVRTLMLAWLSARAAGGVVILRIEDLDRARCKPRFTEQLLDDLSWLGFDWDEGPGAGGDHGPYLQSERITRYAAALAELIGGGFAFPCACSRAELAGVASAPHGPSGPAYPGTCRDRFRDTDDARRRTGRVPAWRFDSRRAPLVRWRDGFRPDTPAPAEVDDFVLWRADGVPAYQLAVVVDDLAMGVTEVVRGDDLTDSTPRQLALIAALGGRAPVYRHVPLVLDEDGRRLAKRGSATQIAEMRAAGVAAERVIGLLARGAGLVDAPVAPPLRTLVPAFAWNRVPPWPVHITDHELRTLSGA